MNEEIEKRIKKLEDKLKIYEDLFEIEDGRLFINSSIGVKGHINNRSL